MAYLTRIAKPFGRRLAVPAAVVLVSPAMAAGLLDEFLAAADRGQCIESVTFGLISDRGPANAAEIVEAALAAHGQREQEQRALGCKGNIAAQAIAAGADPDQVLEATAAGL